VTIFRRNMKKTDAFSVFVSANFESCHSTIEFSSTYILYHIILCCWGYNSTGLSVSLVLNHHNFVRDWKPVVRITCVLMFDVLSNEKSRKSRRGFEIKNRKHTFRNRTKLERYNFCATLAKIYMDTHFLSFP
jgi:hypothetical protein